MTRPRRARPLAARLLTANALVILAGGVTLALAAAALAPGLFQAHLRQAAGTVPPAIAEHLNQAFAAAMLTALAIAVAAATLTALALSWFSALRIARPLRRLADAAQRLRAGEPGVRVPPAPAGDELTVLAQAFNDMAEALDATERTRQRLLADLAHELRTPLATIEGYLEGLTDRVVAPTTQTWTLLRDETARLARLVDDLGAVSKAEERGLDLRLAAHTPHALISAAVRAARPAYHAKGVRLRTAVPAGLPPVEADAQRISEVLANLLDNALRHTPTQGHVEISAAAHNQNVQITVADTGEGIPAEHLHHIFERFYRADPARPRGGSGIGLTIARAIIQAHGGRINATSPGPGHGARFTITLPAHRPASQTSSRT